ncbi:MAG TPA: hypothetical protein VGM92_12950 [Candidatus Kapabacteria bacterium]
MKNKKAALLFLPELAVLTGRKTDDRSSTIAHLRKPQKRRAAMISSSAISPPE